MAQALSVEGMVANVAFKTSHYAPRLTSEGVNVARAESAVTKESVTQ